MHCMHYEPLSYILCLLVKMLRKLKSLDEDPNISILYTFRQRGLSVILSVNEQEITNRRHRGAGQRGQVQPV